MNTFYKELNEIQKVVFEDEQAKSTSEMMEKASTLNLTFEQAEKGLSNIMGDVHVAKWFLKLV